MYARARDSELDDLSTSRVQLVKCACELSYRVLMAPRDPWVHPDPRTWPGIDRLAMILLAAPARLLPDC